MIEDHNARVDPDTTATGTAGTSPVRAGQDREAEQSEALGVPRRPRVDLGRC